MCIRDSFNTAISNDLIAQGDLTINATRTLTIDSNGFVFAYKRLNHNGDLLIANNGQFIQVDETDNNMGVYTGTKFQLTRTAQAKNFDYVYWSAPVSYTHLDVYKRQLQELPILLIMDQGIFLLVLFWF